MSEQADQEDRTEDPTQRRLDDAIKRGDVATSQEVNTFLMLGTFTLVLMIAAAPLARGLLADLRGLLAHLHEVPSDPAGYFAFGRRALVAGLLALAVPMGAVAAAGLVGGLFQHPLVWTAETLAPKVSRISPMAGLKRLLGPEA